MRTVGIGLYSPGKGATTDRSRRHRPGDAPINVKPPPRGSGVKTADKTFMSQSLSEGMLL